MSVRVFTDNSAALHSRIKKLIDQGHITTWAYDPDGDFTHIPNQWKGKAWLRPEERSDMLRFVIIKQQDVPLKREIFAVYHGRFIEMLIAHVADGFTTASASSNPVSGDEPAVVD